MTTSAQPSVAHRVARSPWAVAALAVDVACILAFSAIGRRSHTEAVTVSGTLDTAWPYLVGVGIGWVALWASRWPPASLRGGLVVVVDTVLFGMLLRATVGHEETPWDFVLVGGAFIAVFLLGWRLLAMAGRRLGPRRA